MLMDNLIGQPSLKRQVRMQADFCKRFNAIFPHTLLVASAGQGKTAYSNAIAELLGKEVIQVYCPSIKSEQELMNTFKKPDGSWRDPGCVYLYDEIHAMDLKMAEQLYTLMETFTYAENGVIKPFPRFTLIGATTEPHMMSKPLRDRFINQFVFEPYTEDDMRQYIDHLGAAFVAPTAEDRIAHICNFTPRLVNAFMKKLHMYVIANLVACVDDATLTEYLEKSGFTPDGLTAIEDKYLRLLGEQKRASLSTISNLLGMKQSMVSAIIEPVLIARGYLEMGVGGRILTQKGNDIYGK